MKITLLFILLSSKIAFAQKPSENHFSLGTGVIFKQNIRNDNQYDKADKSTQFRVIPMARIKVGPISITGPNIKLTLPRYKFVVPSISIKRAGERYYGPGMEWRKDSWFAEAALNILMFKLTYSRDIHGRSHGEVIDLSYNGRLMLGSVMLNYTLSHRLIDKEFSNYYYGVRPNEVTATRRLYTPGSSGSYTLAISPIWIISENWSLFNSLSATTLESEIKDSPTVSRSWYLSGISGITYTFD